MITKYLLCPQRLRQIPPSFSRVDDRLVRHDHFRQADLRAWSLYLFLVTVADVQAKHSDRFVDVDRQLFGRAGRQGDPGSAQAFLSAEDELVRRHLPARTRQALVWTLTSRVPGWGKAGCPAFAAAQWRAQRQAFKQRGSVLQADTWLDEALSFSGDRGA